MTSTVPAVHPHAAMLRAIYAELPSVGDYAADDVVLHRADRDAGASGECRGVRAVVAHEWALLEATEHTLVMDVQHIVANDYFGAVLGVLRARRPRQIAMPFCGLWRFAGGRIVEHWENAYDVVELRELFATPRSPRE